MQYPDDGAEGETGEDFDEAAVCCNHKPIKKRAAQSNKPISGGGSCLGDAEALKKAPTAWARLTTATERDLVGEQRAWLKESRVVRMRIDSIATEMVKQALAYGRAPGGGRLATANRC